MIWLSRLLMFSVMLDALMRIIPKLFWITFYLAGFCCCLILLNGGISGLKALSSSPVVMIKYVAYYVKWVYQNQDQVSVRIILKLLFAFFSPYIFYQLAKSLFKWALKKIAQFWQLLFGALLRKMARVFPKLASKKKTAARKSQQDHYYFDVKNRVFIKKSE